ncbi:cupin-like domain-containing protein [Sphingomonas astaxanthinifaciens]|uniref:Cupin n=1 Tax=Sphingomonas astaxanthinifaciens DSM 22298 TaxID=1123267 RepID=A0ABQ5Z8T8_9SPHN|nr:cupin-like domain-containing protein [Sphingomonas astaxanthinifaciens]GLR48347.1 cupin [Sphingomonas astaxanthinifaciens DSM 22298]
MAEPSPVFADLPRVAEESVAADALDARLRGADTPFIVRGVAADWPLVAAGRQNPGAARDYLLGFARERDFDIAIGRPGAERVFYDDAMGMDFRSERWPLARAFDLLAETEQRADPPLVYLASVDMQGYFRGLDVANRLPLGKRQTRDGIWIGGRTRVAAHNDIANNVAVAAVGRRRFTLFPPDQFANLYLGPLENSPGGRPISMVDFETPDFEGFPLFSRALDTASLAELGPGDALFVPQMWYHHVEALDRFNVLVNYWWNDEPRYLGHPEDALFHAILAIRDLPEEARAHWRSVFNHYVFDADGRTTDHVAPEGRGILAPLDVARAETIRMYLLRRLSR